MIRVLTWNIQFFSDDWESRKHYINKALTDHASYDAISFQEMAIGGSQWWSHCYDWAELNNYHAEYSPFVQRKGIFKWKIFEWILNIYYLINCQAFSLLGKSLEKMFDHYIFRVFLLPLVGFFVIPFLTFLFIGTGVFINNKTVKRLKTERLQLRKHNFAHIEEFEKEGETYMYINVHFSPDINTGKGEVKRLKEVKTLLDYVAKEDKNVIIAGDFNTRSHESVYKVMTDAGFRSSMLEKNGEEKRTFPTKGPIKTIDYVWIKGDGLEVEDVKLIGGVEYSDHYGLCVTLKNSTANTGKR